MTTRRDITENRPARDGAQRSGRMVIASVGIDHYLHWARLTNAVSDARGATAMFVELGFEPLADPLLDAAATGQAIQSLVTDDLMALDPNDSLVIFYAGHGGTRTHSLGSQLVKTGYLIPVDASDKVVTWIDLDGWLRAVSLLPPRHILVILDACHSGVALGQVIRWRDSGAWQNTPLSTLRGRRSRRIITSALDDQVALDSGPVHGHSLFTGCLIEGLTHGLARAGRRETTGSELGLYVRRRVETYPNSRQTPDFGTLDFDERGEIVIPLLAGALEAADGSGTQASDLADASVSPPAAAPVTLPPAAPLVARPPAAPPVAHPAPPSSTASQPTTASATPNQLAVVVPSGRDPGITSGVIEVEDRTIQEPPPVARARLRSVIRREVDPPDEERTQRTEPARRSSRGWGWKTLLGNYWVYGFGALAWAISTLTSHCEKAETPHKPEDRGVARAKLVAFLKDRTETGCEVVNAPREYRGVGDTSFTVSGKGGSCVATVLISADPAERLQVSLRSPLGESLPVPPPAATIDLVLCPRMAGEYLVSARPATAASYAMATLHCDGSTMATDSAYRAASETVRTKLTARMQRRLDAGCSVTRALRPIMGEELWELNVKETGHCVEQLVESAPDSPVTVTVTSPTSQSVPVSAPAPSLSVRYCPTRAGSYTHRTQPATDQPYASLVLECPARDLEPRR